MLTILHDAVVNLHPGPIPHQIICSTPLISPAATSAVQHASAKVPSRRRARLFAVCVASLAIAFIYNAVKLSLVANHTSLFRDGPGRRAVLATFAAMSLVVNAAELVVAVEPQQVSTATRRSTHLVLSVRLQT